MKSWNAVAKVANHTLSKLGHFSVLTFLVLSFISGTSAYGAEAFKLWKQAPEGKTPTELAHISGGDRKKAIEWLSGSHPNFSQFVQKFGSEPFKFVEGFRVAMLDAIKNNKLDEFVEKAVKGIKDVEASEFSDKNGNLTKTAFITLLDQLKEMDKSDLEDSEFLKNLFNDERILFLLGLTKKDPKGHESEPDEEEPITPPGSGERSALEKKLLAENAQIRAQMEDMLKRFQESDRNKTGELNDSELRDKAEKFCDKVAALLRARQQENNDSGKNEDLKPIKDAMEEILNKLAKKAKEPQKEDEGKNGLEDILPELLKNALKPEEEEQSMPSPESPSSGGGQPSEEKGAKSPFDQQPPQPPEDKQMPQPQDPGAPFIPPASKSDVKTPINLVLPSNTGRRELRDAQDALAELQGRQSALNTLGPNASLPDMVMARAKVQGDQARAQSALNSAKDRIDRLDEQIEELKEGGEAALPSWVKKKEAQLEQEIKKNEKAIEQLQQSAQAAGKNPQAMSQIQARMMYLNQKKNDAEEALTQFRAEKDAKIEEANKAIRTLIKRRDQLQGVASKLESETKTLKEEESALTQMINTSVQMQMQALQGPAQGATKNVNRIQQFSNGGTTAPRTNGPVGAGMGSTLGGSGLTTGKTRGPLTTK